MNERLLLLDDEPSILEILAQHFAEEPYDCTLTTSPEEALRLVEAGGFSLLMTDLKMGSMHGIEVVQRAKRIDPDIAVIVITALMDIKNAIDALRAGADDYLLKPFNLSEITLAVERALDRRRLIRENRRYQQELEQRVREATSDMEKANRKLLQTKEYLERLLRSSADAILTMDLEGRITFVNPGACELFGMPASALTGAGMDAYFAAGADEARYLLRMVQQHQNLKNYETEIVRRDGRHVPVNMSLSLVEGEDGRGSSVLAICKDITEQKRLEEELKEMSIRDGLTGLYNQRHFYDRLETEIERARRQGHPLSLLLFDIDDFKSYNDCYGHLEGDKVLAEVGKVIVESTREHVDVGFRYGGDEFTVILPEATQEQALPIAERIRALFEARHFDHLTLSIGLMTYREGRSPRSLIRMADAMMYEAKREGGNRVHILDAGGTPAMDAGVAPPERDAK